ncbi:MAG: MFS transporter [Pseudomonadota bacterium]|nr:MFS transporter [Pseudomonadota bacterium]
MDKKPLLGLAGAIVAAMAAEFNDQVSAIALVDVRGAMGIGHDAGTWIESLYVTAMVIGMALSPFWSTVVTLRRMVLFAIGLNLVSSVLIPFAPNIEILYLLRIFQGLAQGFTIPLLMAAALRFLPPPIRLWGLCCYALTATFFPNLSAGVAALWTEFVDWRFVFWEAIPLCTLAGLLVWHGMPQDPMNLARIRQCDWSGTALVILGMGALTTMLEHGNRLDWFNSPLICVLALVSAVAVPLFVLNEWRSPAPLIGVRLLGRPNVAYAVITLFCFIMIGMSSSAVPMAYLAEVQGYRPLQSATIMLEIAALQFLYLPLAVYVLKQDWVDSRWVNGFGLVCIMVACIGCSQLTSAWNREQFYMWQAISGLGQAFVVVSLLMMGTNAVVPQEGPQVSPLINMPRAVAQALGTCLLELVAHFRGELHGTRLIERAGSHAFALIRGPALDPRHAPPLAADGSPRSAEALGAFHEAIVRQQAVMVASDQYLFLAGLAGFVLLVLILLPVRTYPPHIALVKATPGQAPPAKTEVPPAPAPALVPVPA